ncbi:MAG: FkbM family methyltransferase [Bacteriovoracaceae bacterium]|nr:FkbM family methyltransferase [Bacteriovoracaceae bacterium]
MKFDNWSNLFTHTKSKFTLCDIGARGGLEQPWINYQDFLSIVAFEPDKEECQNISENFTIINKALSLCEEEKNLYLTKNRGASSLLKPNLNFLNSFPECDRFNIESNQQISCVALDDLYKQKKIESLDFVKIDTQGTELDIIKGGEKILKQCVGLQIEVEFHQLYQNQPLFSDIDVLVRNSLNMDLQDLKKSYWKYQTKTTTLNTKGSLIFGDALYFRAPNKIEEWLEQFPQKQKVNKTINLIFAGFVYGYYDYCFKLLELPITQQLIGENLCAIENILKKNNKNLAWLVPTKWRSRIGHRLNILASFFRPTHNNWATIGESLGNRKKFGFFTNH